MTCASVAVLVGEDCAYRLARMTSLAALVATISEYLPTQVDRGERYGASAEELAEIRDLKARPPRPRPDTGAEDHPAWRGRRLGVKVSRAHAGDGGRCSALCVLQQSGPFRRADALPVQCLPHMVESPYDLKQAAGRRRTTTTWRLPRTRLTATRNFVGSTAPGGPRGTLPACRAGSKVNGRRSVRVQGVSAERPGGG
jgi:hypothetical protein